MPTLERSTVIKVQHDSAILIYKNWLAQSLIEKHREALYYYMSHLYDPYLYNQGDEEADLDENLDDDEGLEDDDDGEEEM